MSFAAQTITAGFLFGLVLPFTAGCALTERAVDVGNRTEYMLSWHELYVQDNTLVIGFTVARWEQGDPSSRPADPLRWVKLPVESLYWRKAQKPTDLSATRAPTACPFNSTAKKTGWNPVPLLRDLQQGDNVLAAAAPSHQGALTAHTFDAGVPFLLLVKDDPQDEVPWTTTVHLSSSSCASIAPWAKPVRTVLVPLAVIADVVTAPIQIGIAAFR